MRTCFVRHFQDHTKNLTGNFIDEYIYYIKYTIGKREYLKNYQEDIQQYVIMHLLKIYPKRYKYTDWDFVVKTTVRRRVMDYSNKFNKDNTRLKYKNEITNDVNEYFNIFENEFSLKKFCGANEKDENKRYEIIDWITCLNDKISDKENKKLYNMYTDWDREFLEVLIELYEHENEPNYENLRNCMGYLKEDNNEFISRLNTLRKKITASIEDNLIENIL